MTIPKWTKTTKWTKVSPPPSPPHAPQTQLTPSPILPEDLPYRPNAILLTGSPIAHLPTTRLFAYATHFDAHPLGLEWVDDTTCVLVFDSRRSALDGFARLQKSASEPPDMTDDCVTARPFPIALWPPEERIKQSVGAGEGLKGAIRMRWARRDDVKKKGAMRQSEFYKRHGAGAGKEVFNGRDLPAAKRRRREDGERGGGGAWEDEEAIRARLDEELDSFLKEDSTDDEGRANGHRNGKSPAGDADVEGDYDDLPPSKMRSDYIADDGRTLLQRTSAMRAHRIGAEYDNDAPDLASRLTKPLPRRAPRSGGWPGDSPIKTNTGLDDRLRSPPREKLEWGRTEGDGRRRRRGAGGDRDRDRVGVRERSWRGSGGGGGRTERPKKTQQELDDELDAFLRAS
ncbi:hypothetical protein CVT26_009975 [Gymnopilus dilepis]|uniref:Chromatin target of PRMT1 protein C-terminal domain-containing protein n=1 Tax=Gymnopilus dilepis TaxID=231916 RepID=A0A409WUQ6_9AGAR|nr:hypothetical protein CVT26_009975 [Gymnopilus dilepis]